MVMTPPIALTIAGSDSGGGAGIQADLKVFAALRVYGTSVITAATAQNTRGVQDVFPMPGNVVSTQLNSLLDDLPPAATKTGMLATAEVGAAVLAKARAGLLPNLVIDPVLASSSGRRLGWSALSSACCRTRLSPPPTGRRRRRLSAGRWPRRPTWRARPGNWRRAGRSSWW
ncbi:hypothetical protein Phou_031540 [Phytohabitans houttuyneae]|uniref:Pyridoxamine kinase/Phosphomethylpyrimidine kinase domain-containing protein n=1 Tax=Phytohabitans houttuyneae TaxID=1076126 RepID=A0A6V8K5D4_9ACTN|nr:hypothetical protein Phou_031540 [Phytohabitans houttuyneae]